MIRTSVAPVVLSIGELLPADLLNDSPGIGRLLEAAIWLGGPHTTRLGFTSSGRAT